MKRFLFLLSLLCLVGCGAYDRPVYVEWGSSVTPFVIQLEGDNKQATVLTEDLLEKSMIGGRRVQITYQWVNLGHGSNNGKYLPQQRLILVDRDPVTRQWTASAATGTTPHDESIQLESKDSVNFSTNIFLTARIVDNKDAIKFLFNYPAGKIETVKLGDSYKDDYEVKKVSLADVMDNEIRTRIQKTAQTFCNEYNMDELRAQKTALMKAVEEDVTKFFKERGITITTVAMQGGLVYANPENQKAIDKIFQAQMDKTVALAETAAANQRKQAMKALGEGEAQKKMAAAEGEATAIKSIADAKAYELKKLTENPEAYLALKELEFRTKALDIWDGHYPQVLMGGENSPNLLVPMPNLGSLPKLPPNPNKEKHDKEKEAGKKTAEAPVSPK